MADAAAFLSLELTADEELHFDARFQSNDTDPPLSISRPTQPLDDTVNPSLSRGALGHTDYQSLLEARSVGHDLDNTTTGQKRKRGMSPDPYSKPIIPQDQKYAGGPELPWMCGVPHHPTQNPLDR